MSKSEIHPNGTTGTNPTPTTPNDPDAIREDIERTRNDLADTVDALQAKLDVKSRAKARVARVKDQATTDTGKPRPDVIAGVMGALLLVAGLVWWRKG
jgi:hypothetical protein